MQPFKAVYFNFQLQFRIHGLFCSFRNTSSNLIQSIYKKFYSPLLLLRQQIPSVQMTLLLCIQVNQIILPIKEFSQCDSFLIRPTISRFILSASSLSFCLHIISQFTTNGRFFDKQLLIYFFNEYGIIDAVSIRGRKRPSIIIFSKKEASYAYFSLNNYSQ